MRRPRMTALRWMIAVAGIILLIYVGIGVMWLWRRHNYFLVRAQGYAEEVSMLSSLQQQLISGSKKDNTESRHLFTQLEDLKAAMASSQEHATEMASKYRRLLTQLEERKAEVASSLDYAAEMVSKYRRAARYPWLSVEHELPEPW